MAKRPPSIKKIDFKNGSEIHLKPEGEQLKGLVPPPAFTELEEKHPMAWVCTKDNLHRTRWGVPCDECGSDTKPLQIEVELTQVAKVGESKSLPIVVSFGIQKVHQCFALITIRSQGKKIVEINYGEPQHFRFAVEDLKLALVTEYENYFEGRE